MVFNNIILGHPLAEDSYYELLDIVPRCTQRTLDPQYFLLEDETNIYQYFRCESFDLPDGFHWETFHKLNNIHTLSEIIWG